ncbi:Phytoene [Hortaea werneckii]|nr:Phytoene [Hortaea werneckii]
MPATLPQEIQVPLKPFLPLPLLHFGFHSSQIATKFEGRPIAEVDAVIGVAFAELDAFGGETRVEFVESLVEEAGEEEEGGSLVETVLLVGGVEEAAAAAGEGVFFQYGHAVAGVREARGGRGSADAGADYYGGWPAGFGVGHCWGGGGMVWWWRGGMVGRLGVGSVGLGESMTFTCCGLS